MEILCSGACCKWESFSTTYQSGFQLYSGFLTVGNRTKQEEGCWEGNFGSL